ncbi:MAG: thiamine diphosphokinase [Clostridia bacterium]|nr:thiamine diphosphokinase [Clostridia bacterium]
MRVVIISGGDYSYSGKITDNDYVICADSGYDSAAGNGINVNLLMGDMDSVRADISEEKEKLLFPSRKDYTDTELAVRRAVEMSPEKIILLGCLGSRADHSLANIFLLKYIHKHGIDACIVDKNNEIYYYKDSFLIKNSAGKTVSLIPLTDKISGITTTGMDYPLKGETLYFGESRGVSNVVIADEAGYKSESGEGIIVITDGN